MHDGRHSLRNPTWRLPDVSLPRVGTAGEEPLRSGRRESVVLIAVHGPACEECAAHVQALAALGDEFSSWDARVIVVVFPPAAEGETDVLPGVPPDFVTVRDEQRHLRDALGTDPPATVVADQWGEIHAFEAADEAHRFVEPAEVAKWVQYLAVRCPECEGESL